MSGNARKSGSNSSCAACSLRQCVKSNGRRWRNTTTESSAFDSLKCQMMAAWYLQSVAASTLMLIQTSFLRAFFPTAQSGTCSQKRRCCCCSFPFFPRQTKSNQANTLTLRRKHHPHHRRSFHKQAQAQSHTVNTVITSLSSGKARLC